jgi:hypothetical protein
MAHKLRVEYAGAIYDVTNRGVRWARFKAFPIIVPTTG